MGIYRVQYLRNDEWKDFLKGGAGDQFFYSMEGAWGWAKIRSVQPGHRGTLYRVWNTAKNRQEGTAYLNGKANGEAEREARRRIEKAKTKDPDVYELFWQRPGSEKWVPFDSSTTRYKDIEEVIERSRDTGFNQHMVRVWRGSEIIFEARTRTHELIAWLEAYASDTTTEREETEMEYEARKALNISKPVLVERLEAKIAEDKAKWDENKAKEEAALADRITALKTMVKENPAGLVKTIEGYISGTFFAKNDAGEFANSKTYIDNYDGSTAEFVPDATATKLVSVLNAAVDETIEVTPSDDFYRYL